MEETKGGGNSADMPEEKHFDMLHLQNPVFSVGVANLAQQQTGSLSNACRSAATKKAPSPKRIPRPMNAFMIFSNENRAEMRKRFPLLQNKELSKRLGAVWRKLSKEEQDVYYRKAKLASEDHRRKYPDYHYRPRGRGPNAPEKLNKMSKNVPTVPMVGNQPVPCLPANIPCQSAPAGSLFGIPAVTADELSQGSIQNDARSRRPRNRVPCQLSLPNLPSVSPATSDAIKQSLFGGTGSDSLANFYQQYFNTYGSNNLLTNSKPSVPSMLNDGISKVLSVPGPAHSNDYNKHYKQLYSHDAQTFPVSSNPMTPWLPPLALGTAAPYAHQPFPVLFLNQQAKSSMPINPYLQNMAWRQQAGIDAYLRMQPNMNDNIHGSFNVPNVSSNGSFLTPPPSHAGSTSSVSSPPFSADSCHSNSSVPPNSASDFSNGQHSLPTPIAPHFSGTFPSRHFFGSHLEVEDTRVGDNDMSNDSVWDASNMDNPYEACATPGYNSCYSSDGSNQQGPSAGSGFIMPDIPDPDEHSGDALNMSAYHGYSPAPVGLGTADSWRELPVQSNGGVDQSMYITSQSNFVLPLALNHHRQQVNNAAASADDNDRQLPDLRVFPEDLLNQDDRSGHTQSSRCSSLNFREGEAFSVSTIATSEDMEDQDASLDDDRLLNFNFDCDDGGVPDSAVDGMLESDYKGTAESHGLTVESYGNYEASNSNRWDLQDDLNDDSAPDANCRPRSHMVGAPGATMDSVLLEATASVM